METKEIHVSPLKQAFENSRKERNIDLILPVFLTTKLFAIGKKIAQDAEPEFFLTKSPDSERFCVTVSETPDNFKSIQENIDLIQMTGEVLLNKINPAFEILIAYGDGGDILSREQLDWFRRSISNLE